MPYDRTVNDAVRSYWTRRRGRWQTGALVVSVVVSAALVLTSDRARVGHWRSAAGKAAYERAYDAVLATMPAPAETRDVPTGYGIVRVYRFEPVGGPPAGALPILLLPGWGAGAPMWRDNLPGLLAGRTVYALDALGDAGRSIQSVPLESAAAQAEWVAQTLAGLDVARAHVVGHSFGGWAALNVAIHHPDRVATLSLLDPVQTFSPLRWQVYASAIPASVPWLPQSWRDRALADIGGIDSVDRSDAMTAMIDAGTQHYVSQRAFPQRPSPEQLQALPMPVYAAMAGASSVNADPDAAVSLARAHVRDIEIRVWPGATHSLPMEQSARVDAELLDVMARQERGPVTG